MSRLIFEKNKKYFSILTNKQAASDWIDALYAWLFALDEAHRNALSHLAKHDELQQQLQVLIYSVTEHKETAEEKARALFNQLEQVHSKLEEDLETVLRCDPAANSTDEVLLSYPGFFATAAYRVAHELWLLDIPVIPRIITESIHRKTGIDIHPAATIGRRFFIDHGTGIVIGATTQVGNDVKIYQGVTLGALSVEKEMAKFKRHPTIEDGVVIYANATILGGATTIGNHSTIGGNVWLTNSVPPYSLVYHKSEVIVKEKSNPQRAIDFII
ncbi:MAG: serine acetyltransferase [Taibaiella sp.]|nr:serine acetyltransferase [Taibaiella sp.]